MIFFFIGNHEKKIPKNVPVYPIEHSYSMPSYGYEIDLTSSYPTSASSPQNTPIYPIKQENSNFYTSEFSMSPSYPPKIENIPTNVPTLPVNPVNLQNYQVNSKPTAEQHNKDNLKHYFETLKMNNQEILQPSASSNHISLPPIIDSKAVTLSADTSRKKDDKKLAYKLENYREPITKPDQIKRSLPSFYLYDPYQFKNKQYAQPQKKNGSYDDIKDFDAIFADNTPDKIHDYKIDHSQYDGENKEKRLSASYFKSTVFDGTGQPIYEARTELSNEERQRLGLKVIFFYRKNISISIFPMQINP